MATLTLLNFISISSAANVPLRSRQRVTTGRMILESKCSFPVWFQMCYGGSCSDGESAPWNQLPNGYSYSYSVYQPIGTGINGLTINFGRAAAATGITQLQTHWNPTGRELNYALSENEDGGTIPFFREGYIIWPVPATSDGYPTCNAVHCGSGEKPCTGAYESGDFREDSMMDRMCTDNVYTGESKNPVTAAQPLGAKKPPMSRLGGSDTPVPL